MKPFVCISWLRSRLAGVAAATLAAATFFSVTPIAWGAESDDLDSLSEDQIPPDRVSRPYQPRSLKGLTPEQLVKWMGPGKSMRRYVDDQKEKRLGPAVDNWAGTPESVIRALVVRKRADIANKRNPLIIDLSESQLPESGLNSLRSVYSSCSQGFTEVWAVRWNPGDSWVVGSSMERQSKPLFGPLSPREDFNLGFFPVNNADARRMTELMAVIARCRTAKPGRTPDGTDPNYEERYIFMSSIVGSMTVVADTGKPILQLKGKIWGDRDSHRHNIGWCDELGLHLAVEVLSDATARFAKLREQNDPNRTSAVGDVGELSPKLLATVRQSAKRALELAVTSPDLIHLQHVNVAIWAAGEFGFQELRTKIDEVAARLPELSDWEQRTIYLESEISAKNQALAARLEPGLAEFIADQMNLDFRSESQEKTEASFSPDARAELAALRELSRERRERSSDLELSAEDVPGRNLEALRRTVGLVARQFAARDNVGELKVWAAGRVEGSGWAYRRLRALDAEAANDVIEKVLKKLTKADYQFSQLVDRLREHAPERARKFIASLPTEQRFDLEQERTAEPGTVAAASVSELLGIVRDRTRKFDERTDALGRLVPGKSPNLHSDPSVDQQLVEVLASELALSKDEEDDSVSGSLASRVFGALAMRDPVKHWSTMANAIPALEERGYSGAGTFLDALIPAVDSQPSVFRPKMVALLQPRLKATRDSWERLLWIAWACDLREMRSQIAGMATSKPEDYGEDETFMSSKPKVHRHRIHLARQITSLWDEPDAATRIQMLVALGLSHSFDFTDRHEHLKQRMNLELLRDIATLSPGERERLWKDIDSVQSTWLEAGQVEPDAGKKFIRTVMLTLGALQ